MNFKYLKSQSGDAVMGLVAVLALVALAGVGYYVYTTKLSSSTPAPTSSVHTPTAAATAPAPKEVTADPDGSAAQSAADAADSQSLGDSTLTAADTQ